MTKSGQRILPRISKKPWTLAAERLLVFHELTEGENLSEEMELVWPETPPWHGVELPMSTEIPKVQRKGHQNNIVTRQLVEDLSALQYQGLVRSYTDASVRRGSCSSTVA